MWAPGQCCGATGVGSLLIDLAVREEDERHWDAARSVAAHLLLRSAGPIDHPVFVEPTPDARASSWATGTAGLLGFFRRLADRGGPDCIPVHSSADAVPVRETAVRASVACTSTVTAPAV
jgi:hypothetical protein